MYKLVCVNMCILMCLIAHVHVCRCVMNSSLYLSCISTLLIVYRHTLQHNSIIIHIIIMLMCIYCSVLSHCACCYIYTYACGFILTNCICQCHMYIIVLNLLGVFVCPSTTVCCTDAFYISVICRLFPLQPDTSHSPSGVFMHL